MKNVILYTRISSDEQSKYSLNDQISKLEKYCSAHQLIIGAKFQDDYSAKTFHRPGFRSMLEFIKHNKQIDGLLVVLWDRFSRNVEKGYSVLARLNEAGIEVNAIDQWIDWDVPEQEYLFALYLVGGQVFNKRLSMRVHAGMRQGKKQGRWMGSAPFGYVNKRDESGQAYIIPGEKGEWIKKAFYEFARGIHTIESLRQYLKANNAPIPKSTLHRALVDPVYIGKIKISAWKNEPEQIINGVHQSIIDIHTFQKVQDILNGIKRNQYRKYDSINADLPLRGHIICEKCGKNMTGSASKGKGGTYHYYHCHAPCNERIPAAKAHTLFMQYLKEIKPPSGLGRAWLKVVEDVRSQVGVLTRSETRSIENQLTDIEEKLFKVDEKFIEGDLDKESYGRLKRSYTEQRGQLIARKAEQMTDRIDIMKHAKYGILFLTDIDYIYEKTDAAGKSKIISSTFPKKLIFSENKCRTPELSPLLSVFNSKINYPQPLQKERGIISDTSSLIVHPLAHVSKEFIDDLKLIYQLSSYISIDK